MLLKKTNTCSQDIKRMKKGGSQRYCESCRKNVVDFRNYTTDEILDYFKKHGKPCMILFDDQVNAINARHQTSLKNISVMRKAAAVAGLVVASNFAAAQQPETGTAATEKVQQENLLEVYVTDKKGAALTGKALLLKTSGKEFSGTTDSNGKYIFSFDKNITLSEYTIVLVETGEEKTYSVQSEAGRKNEKSVKFVSSTEVTIPAKLAVKGKVINNGSVEINMRDVSVVIELKTEEGFTTVKKKQLKKDGTFEFEIPSEIFSRGKVFIKTESVLSYLDHDGTSLDQAELLNPAHATELTISRHPRRITVGFF